MESGSEKGTEKPARPARTAVEEPIKLWRKRKEASPAPILSQQSPRKQRKVAIAVPIQEVSFSSLPDDHQIVQAGRARRRKALEEQRLRDEQSWLDRQLVSQLSSNGRGGLDDPREVVVVSSDSDGEWGWE